MAEPRIVVLSNRLPVSLQRRSRKRYSARPGHGGLVTALTPVLRERDGIWIGWPGTQVEPEAASALRAAVDGAGRDMGVELFPVTLTAPEVKGYYRGFANEVLWPLFHDLLAQCNFDPAFWRSYRAVNRKMAAAAERVSGERDFVWVQDYHLLQVARELRRRGTRRRVGFFLHVPFPAPDMFLRLPWREQLLDGLLDFDVLGFQSERDRGNFLQCVTAISPRSTIGGSGTIRVAADSEGGAPRSVRVGSFPIGIDDRAFRGLAGSDEVRERAARLREELGGGTILLGVDRLDYTKGLLHKLRGYRTALKRYRGLREKVRLVQHVVPSREAVPQYRRLRPEVERLVGEINGEFGTPGWTPVRYFYHALEREELVAYYRLADVLLVTSLKDGMNLVAKEYCASNVDERGVLVLSEFTGAAAQLGDDALLVNPYDSEGLARGIREAVSMPPARRRARMSRLRRVVGEADVYRWVQTYLDAVRREPRPAAPRADGPRAAFFA